MLLAQDSDNEVIHDQRWPSVAAQTLVIRVSDFDVQKLERRFRAILQRTNSEIHVLRVEVFTDRQEAISGNCKCSTDVTYVLWRSLFRDYESHIIPSAELLMIDGSAAMRVREASGRVVTKILQGSDPYLLKLTGSELEILHMAVVPAEDSFQNQAGKTSVRLDFFLLASAPFDESTAGTATQRLREATGIEEITLAIRSDPWFIVEDTFPVAPRYVTDLRPPTKEQYEEAPQYTCVADAKHINCWRQGLYR